MSEDRGASDGPDSSVEDSPGNGSDNGPDNGVEDPLDAVDVGDTPTYCSYTEYERGVDVADLPATGEGAEGAVASVFEELYGVEDPEMPISVVDLGLIYDVTVEDGHATVTMTLTYTGCPARDYLQEDVRLAAERADGVNTAEVELVWSPEWNLEMVTSKGREDLRAFGVSV